MSTIGIVMAEDQPTSAPVVPTSGTGTSLSMLDRVRADDPEAWRRLVQLYGPLVYSWGRRSGLRDEDAADLLQEVWRAVAAGIARFQRDPGSGSFRGWLWTIARNKLRDHFRARRQLPEAVGGSEARERMQELPEAEPADESEGGGGGGLLHRALDLIRGDFEERTWQAFWRTTVDGQPAAEVASELGMAVDAVYQAKSRVLRRLREELRGLIE